jgi:hypothetical protein
MAMGFSVAARAAVRLFVAACAGVGFSVVAYAAEGPAVTAGVMAGEGASRFVLDQAGIDAASEDRVQSPGQRSDRHHGTVRGSMTPMLIGHSQGGMVAIKVLHELAGDFGPSVPVWNPGNGAAEGRTAIIDPVTGKERPVVGLKVPYAAALATGKLPRLLLGQWSMLTRLREIPDTVDEFTAFSLEWDPIAGNFGTSEPYRATGSAQVRNLILPASASHLTLPRVAELARDPATREWIDRYAPGTAVAPPTVQTDTVNLLHAADIWYSVKKHWCLEAQRLIRARRSLKGRE